MRERLPALFQEQHEAALREAGFTDVELLHTGFTLQGRVACRA